RKLARLETHLPFLRGLRGPPQPVSFRPVGGEENHPLLLGERGEPPPWDRLPPLIRHREGVRAKPGSLTIAALRGGPASAGEPLLVIRSLNGRKSAAILAHGLWQWRLMGQENPATERFLASFLGNAVRWLARRDEGSPVRVSPLTEIFTEGAPAAFEGEAYDQTGRPADNALLRLAIEGAGGRFDLELRPAGPGRYEGSLEGLPAGDYAFRAEALKDGRKLGESRGRFSVGGVDLELADTRMNAPLIRQLAFRTGGRSYNPGSLHLLARDLPALARWEPTLAEKTSRHELWTGYHLLAAVLLCFSLEWFLRKWSGML
ncbi:MAG: hypothetical protein WB626_03515, partial [Bacteroidota bacterium]